MKRIDVNIREDQYNSLKEKVEASFKTMSHFVREALDRYFGNERVLSESDYPKWLQDILSMLDLVRENMVEDEQSIELFWDTLLLPLWGAWAPCRKIALTLVFWLKKAGVECYEEDDIEGKRGYIGIRFNFPEPISKEMLLVARKKIVEMVMGGKDE